MQILQQNRQARRWDCAGSEMTRIGEATLPETAVRLQAFSEACGDGAPPKTMTNKILSEHIWKRGTNLRQRNQWEMETTLHEKNFRG